MIQCLTSGRARTLTRDCGQLYSVLDACRHFRCLPLFLPFLPGCQPGSLNNDLPGPRDQHQADSYGTRRNDATMSHKYVRRLGMASDLRFWQHPVPSGSTLPPVYADH